MPLPALQPPALRHLRLWLGALEPLISAALALQRARVAALAGRQIVAHAITPDHADMLAEQGGDFLRDGYPVLPRMALDPAAAAEESALLAAHPDLPLTILGKHLAPHERSALFVCAAAALSPSHTRLFAYLVDDLSRAHASIELLLALTAGEAANEAVRRRDFGPSGRLVRLGLTEIAAPAEGMRAAVALRAGVLDWLTGACRSAPLRLSDPDLVAEPRGVPLPDTPETPRALALIEARRGVVAIWGTGDRAALVEAVAASAGLPLRRIVGATEEAIEAGLVTAAAEDSIGWLDLEALPGDSRDHLHRLGLQLTGRMQPVLISGREPWRATPILVDGHYAELVAQDVDSASAVRRFAEETGADEATARALTGRYRFTESQRRIVGALVATRDVESASRMAAATRSTPFATLVEPQRGPGDLVLPATLHQQVLEIATFFVAAPAVDERWGFGGLSASPGAIKVLFTGDPGTGKTLAAEVVAKLLGRHLLKVDLAQITSKWVGETEKNLQSVFDAAEEAAAVLFFDEADTLFGKRGEIRHGTDRYANLEVGFLLQRLESYRGLAILASNLRDEIDPAFTRRFQMMLHFPRPGEEERRRLWQRAFVDGTGSAIEIDWDSLVRLDLTGAGIVSSARLASLIAATRGDGTISHEHVNEAIARQFRQEARLFRGARPPDRLSALA